MIDIFILVSLSQNFQAEIANNKPTITNYLNIQQVLEENYKTD